MVAKRSKVSAAHIRLDIPMELGRFDADLNRYIQEAGLAGQEILAQLLKTGKNLPADETRRIQRLYASFPAEQKPLRLLMSAITCHVAGRLMEEHRGGLWKFTKSQGKWDAIKFHALGNTQLIHCLLTLDPIEFQRVRELPTTFTHISEDRWRSIYSGALSVARLASFLISQGHQVYLPTSDEDIHQKIDLIFRIPGGSQSACFQVKTGASRHDLDWYAHFPYFDRQGKSPPAAHMRFVEGVQQFNDRHKGDFLPVVVTLGGRDFEPDSLVPRPSSRTEVQLKLMAEEIMKAI